MKFKDPEDAVFTLIEELYETRGVSTSKEVDDAMRFLCMFYSIDCEELREEKDNDECVERFTVQLPKGLKFITLEVSKDE